MLDRLGMAELLDADTSARLSGGQAKRVALARTLVAEQRPARARRADQPPRHRRHRLAGGPPRRPTGAGWCSSPTTATCSTGSPPGCSSSTGARGYVHDGGYAAYLEGRAERDEQAAAAESTRRNLARKELAWLRRGAPARTRKPKARIEAATAIVEGRAEARPPARASPDLHLGTPRLGDKVVELARRRPSLRRRADALFDGVDLLLDPRERLGSSAPTAPGKSTLLDVDGRSPAHRPRADVAHRARRCGSATTTSSASTLDPTQRVRDAVTGGHRAARLAGRRPARVVLVRHRRPVGPHRPAVGRRAAAAPAAAGAGRPAQRAAARRAHQRPRPRHPPGRSRTSSTTGPARSSWSATTGPSSSAPSPTWW